MNFEAILDKYGVAVAVLAVFVAERFTLMKAVLRLLTRIDLRLEREERNRSGLTPPPTPAQRPGDMYGGTD